MTLKAIPFAKDVDTGQKIKLDLEKLLSSRMFIQADSGGGKSFMLRSVVEQSYGQVQQIIIEPEGEFHTLKEKHDFLLIGKSSQELTVDIEVNMRYIKTLVDRILTSGANAIVDLYELPMKDKRDFVKEFCEALIDARKILWHPVLIIIDEIQMFAPEKGYSEATSSQAIVDLATRGRKRGFALIGATQNLTAVDKEVVRQLKNKMIGSCTLDIDMKRACELLGFERKRMYEFARLGDNFEFYVAGPAISKTVIKIKSLPVETTHESGWRRGKTKVILHQSDQIKKLLDDFADLPEEAEKELKTTADYKKKISELNVELRKTKILQPKVDPQESQKQYVKGYTDAKRDHAKIVQHFEKQVGLLETKLHTIQKSAKELENFAQLPQKIVMSKFDDVPKLKMRLPVFISPAVTGPSVIVNKSVSKGQPISNDDIEFQLTGPFRKVLTAILLCPSQRGSRKRIALYCGYAVKGGAYGNILGKLRSNGFIAYDGDHVSASEKGLAAIPTWEPLPTEPQEIIGFWTQKLGQAKGKILTAIFENNPIEREQLAEITGYTESGGAFGNTLGNLRTLGLIDYLPGRQIGISKELFPVFA